MQNNQFINIKLTTSTLDRYYVRTSILKSLNQVLPQLSGKLLDTGCGQMPYRKHILDNSQVTKYVGLDIENAKIYDKNITPDFRWDGVKMPFEENTFDCAIATEVMEHCPDTLLFLSEVIRVLKPGGVFFFTVPFLWNLHETPHDEYRFTPFSMNRLLKQAGFQSIRVEATGGWHASMAQMLGLWVKRAPMHHRLRRALSILLLPIIKKLIQQDQNHLINFNQSPMITGLHGQAQK